MGLKLKQLPIATRLLDANNLTSWVIVDRDNKNYLIDTTILMATTPISLHPYCTKSSKLTKLLDIDYVDAGALPSTAGTYTPVYITSKNNYSLIPTNS